MWQTPQSIQGQFAKRAYDQDHDRVYLRIEDPKVGDVRFFKAKKKTPEKMDFSQNPPQILRWFPAYHIWED